MPSPNTFITISVQIYVAISIAVAWAVLWGSIGFIIGLRPRPERIIVIPERDHENGKALSRWYQSM